MLSGNGTWPTASTKLAAVIGQPIDHSLSPAIHNAAFQTLGLDWVYLAFQVSAAELEGAVRAIPALGIRGVSVTIPHKTRVAAYMDSLVFPADIVGAVNTIVCEGGQLIGHNTDGEGFIQSLRHDAGFDPSGRRCSIIGAGGAARVVALALAGAGAAEVSVINRTSAKAEDLIGIIPSVGRPGNASELSQADLVVNATPFGMKDSRFPEWPEVLLSAVRKGQTVVDLVYDPPITPLMQAATSAGASAIGGLGMLVYQAGLAFRLWTGREAPLDVMFSALKAD